jgi:hypothetical protein
MADAAAGDSSAARAIADRLARAAPLAVDATARGQLSLARARLAAALGQRADAVAFLRQVAAEEPMWYQIHRLTAFVPLQGYAPYEALMRPRG